MFLKRVKLLPKQLLRIAIAILIVALFVSFAFSRHETPLSESARAWRDAISLMGAEKAYAMFVESAANLDQGSRHSLAHAFGAGLYAKEGERAFPVCKDIYEYGCAHGFIAQAMRESGVAVVKRFADVCRKQGYPVMCMHGIGHGLVSYLGYEETAFSKSVRVCEGVVQDTSVAGCIGGAVMEYGLKTMAQAGTPIRSMTKENRYEPCESISSDAKSSCYFWLPGWWYSVFTTTDGKTPEVAIRDMGALCISMNETEFSGECFGGVGDMATVAGGYDGARVVELCELASEESSYQLMCKAYAANILLGDTRTKDEARVVCDSLPLREKDRCQFLAWKGVSIFDTK
ncbi:MAG: hypothetical protein RIQ56_668 [Candidatus Parcubacteria bacterium]|jgi:hypothetical protein